MIGKVSRHHRPQPSSLCGDGIVHASTELVLDVLEPRSHAIAPRFALQLEAATPGLAADEREPQKREGRWLTQTASPPSLSRMATKLQQARLLLVQFESKALEPQSHRIPEAPRVGFMLKAHNGIVGVSHDNDVACGFSRSPLLGPEVEDVVQVDISEQR